MLTATPPCVSNLHIKLAVLADLPQELADLIQCLIRLLQDSDIHKG